MDYEWGNACQTEKEKVYKNEEKWEPLIYKQVGITDWILNCLVS